MLNIFFRILIAAVVAVVVSAFYAGSLKPDVIYFLDLRVTLSFAIATIVTALLSGVPSRLLSSSSSHSYSNENYSNSDSEDREEGTVKWFNVSKGFGFITRECGEDIFVHYRSIRGEGRRRLHDGQAVEFSIIDSDKGLQADDVEILA